MSRPLWSPSAALLDDTRNALARAPRHTPEDRFEAWAWGALLDEQGPQLLTRHAAPSHVTASGVVLSPDATSTCLVLHGRIKAWVQPGGHLEPADDSLAQAAAREVLEETGLSGGVRAGPLLLSRHQAPCRPGVVDWHLDVQFLVVAEPVPPTVSDESDHVAWWPVDALPPDTAWGVPDLVRRAVAALRPPR